MVELDATADEVSFNEPAAPRAMTASNDDERSMLIAAEPEQHGLRPWLIRAAKLLLCVALLAWLISSGRLDVSRLAAVAGSYNFPIMVVCLLVSMALPAARWWWLLSIQGIHESFGEVLRLTWIGYFAGIFLPGGAGGDLAKVYLIAHGRTSLRLRAASTVVVDRFVGLFSLLLLSCGSFALIAIQGELTTAMTSIALTTVSLTAGMLAMPLVIAWRPARSLALRILPNRLRQMLRPLRDAWHLYRGNTRALLGCLLISLVSNSFVMFALAAGASALRVETSPVTVFLVGPIMVLANCLPLTPGGAGVGEAAGERLFAMLGLVGGAEVMLLTRIIMVLASAPAGLLLRSGKREKSN